MLVARPDDPAPAIVRYVGAPVAAVAAISMAAAEEALRLIRVDYEPLPFVVDMDEAREAGAPPVYDSASAPAGHRLGLPVAARACRSNGNVRGPATVSRGDLAQGFAQADVVIEGEYRTQVQTHCCLEPHAIVADWRADGLTVHMSTQFTAGVRQELAEAFDLPLEPRARDRRRHGRWLRIEVVARQLWPHRRAAVAPGAVRRCASCSTGKKSRWMPAIARRPGSACASARGATAR